MPNTDRDRLAKTLKFEALESSFGFSRVRAVAEDAFLNGVDIAHGGWLYSLADFALALAVNTDEKTAVSSEASIRYVNQCPAGTVVIAEARLPFENSKTAICDVTLKSENGETVFALFQARAIFIKPKA